MITYSVCMDCQAPLGAFTATAGVASIRFDLSHGLCQRCKDIRLAEIESIRLARAVAAGLEMERERESRRLRSLASNDTNRTIANVADCWDRSQLARLVRECEI